MFYGGEGEIRTPGTRQGTLAFEASAIDHSATSPHLVILLHSVKTFTAIAQSLFSGSGARIASLSKLIHGLGTLRPQRWVRQPRPNVKPRCVSSLTSRLSLPAPGSVLTRQEPAKLMDFPGFLSQHGSPH